MEKRGTNSRIERDLAEIRRNGDIVVEVTDNLPKELKNNVQYPFVGDKDLRDLYYKEESWAVGEEARRELIRVLDKGSEKYREVATTYDLLLYYNTVVGYSTISPPIIEELCRTLVTKRPVGRIGAKELKITREQNREIRNIEHKYYRHRKFLRSLYATAVVMELAKSGYRKDGIIDDGLVASQAMITKIKSNNYFLPAFTISLMTEILTKI